MVRLSRFAFSYANRWSLNRREPRVSKQAEGNPEGEGRGRVGWVVVEIWGGGWGGGEGGREGWKDGSISFAQNLIQSLKDLFAGSILALRTGLNRILAPQHRPQSHSSPPHRPQSSRSCAPYASLCTLPSPSRAQADPMEYNTPLLAQLFRAYKCGPS